MWTTSDRFDCCGLIVRSSGIGAFSVYWFFSERVSEYCEDYKLVKVKVFS
jgi:hypothetical protein